MAVKEVITLIDAAISWLMFRIMHLKKAIQENDRKLICRSWNQGMYGVELKNYVPWNLKKKILLYFYIELISPWNLPDPKDPC